MSNHDFTRITLRQATAADVPQILALIKELAEFEKLSHLVVATDEMLHAALFGPEKSVEAMVAVPQASDGSEQPAVAFALYYHNFSTFLGRRGLYLEDLYVQPAFRGGGLGKRFLVRLAQLAVERNCGRFDWAVLDWNAPAIGFYQSLGATVLPDWRTVRVTGDALQALATSVQA